MDNIVLLYKFHFVYKRNNIVNKLFGKCRRHTVIPPKYYSNFICTMLTIAFLLIANIQYLHLFIVRNFVWLCCICSVAADELFIEQPLAENAFHTLYVHSYAVMVVYYHLRRCCHRELQNIFIIWAYNPFAFRDNFQRTTTKNGIIRSESVARTQPAKCFRFQCVYICGHAKGRIEAEELKYTHSHTHKNTVNAQLTVESE